MPDSQTELENRSSAIWTSILFISKGPRCFWNLLFFTPDSIRSRCWTSPNPAKIHQIPILCGLLGLSRPKSIKSCFSRRSRPNPSMPQLIISLTCIPNFHTEPRITPIFYLHPECAESPRHLAAKLDKSLTCF